MKNLIYIEDFGELYTDVQQQKIFTDQKTFVDSEPLIPVDEIRVLYAKEKSANGFNLKDFIEKYFKLPEMVKPSERQKQETDIEKYIENLWDVLTKTSEKYISTLIHLPGKFVVPGGRFREIFYWDSYFTMLGLQEHKRYDLIESMIANFAFLIDNFGLIPNGNRSYFLSRSQPPFFALMIKLLCEIKGNHEPLLQYLPQLEKEYQFWMRGKEELTGDETALHHLVKMPGGEILNRYFDELKIARPEGYMIDSRIAGNGENASEIFSHIRAACESGWDFSSRWFADRKNIETIEAADIVSIDQNCLLVHLEQTLAEGYSLSNRKEEQQLFEKLSTERIAAINTYLWNSEQQFYDDYNFKKQRSNNQLTAAAMFPLFFNIADHEQSLIMAEKFSDELFADGGMRTTLNHTGQQWDEPNGWAPLQWIAYKGLFNYGFKEEANNLKHKWMTTIEKEFAKSGSLKEKYNISGAPPAEVARGEYANQEGFGWTNGVYIKMKYCK